jgi:hypothetical protein
MYTDWTSTVDPTKTARLYSNFRDNKRIMISINENSQQDNLLAVLIYCQLYNARVHCLI